MHQQLADYQVFWRQFRETYHSTGAVLPSGRALAQALSRFVRDPNQLAPGEAASAAGMNCRPSTASSTLPLRRILEVGPGTGSVTAQIVRDMRSGDQLVLVELNEQFVARLRDRFAQTPLFQAAAERTTLLHAAVEDLAEDQPFDLIISGLPLNNFSLASVEQILAKLRRLLATNGTLSFFEYVAIRRAKSLVSRSEERARLQDIGRVFDTLLRTSEVQRDLVLANVPPAWVHHVRWGRESTAESRGPDNTSGP